MTPGILAIEQRARRLGIDLFQPAQDAVLTPHIVRALDIRPKRRSAQHQFLLAQTQEVCQVGVSARELLNRQRTAAPLAELASR